MGGRLQGGGGGYRGVWGGGGMSAKRKFWDWPTSFIGPHPSLQTGPSNSDVQPCLSSPPAPSVLCLCVCVCVEGKNNIKEGGPHGSRAPSGRLRRQLTRQVVCVWGGGGGGYHIKEEGLHGSRGGRPAEGACAKKGCLMRIIMCVCVCVCSCIVC